MDQAGRLLPSQSFRSRHGLFRNDILYALQYDDALGWSAVQQLCFTVLALPLFFATSGNVAAYSLQIKAPDTFRAEIVELDKESNNASADAACAVKICLEEGPFFVYKEKCAPAPRAREILSKKTMLSSSIVSIGRKKRKTATRSGGGENDGLREAETEQVRIETGEENLKLVGKEKITENIN